MFPQLLQYNDIGILILRLAVAAVFIYHAIPKLKNPSGMAAGMGWPKAAIVVLGLVELFSSLGLIFGIYMQLSALLLSFVMIGAIFTKKTKWHTPFSSQQTMGWEFDFILLAANIFILLGGGGSLGF